MLPALVLAQTNQNKIEGPTKEETINWLISNIKTHLVYKLQFDNARAPIDHATRDYSIQFDSKSIVYTITNNQYFTSGSSGTITETYSCNFDNKY
jgi:hypothetical protein